jgi:hypothetical protein
MPSLMDSITKNEDSKKYKLITTQFRDTFLCIIFTRTESDYVKFVWYNSKLYTNTT